MIIRASSLLQARECPGSVAAQQDLPEVASSDADKGTRLHEAVSQGWADAELSPDERRTVEKLRDRQDALVEEYAGSGKLGETVREHRFLFDGVSGHPDWVGLVEMEDGTNRALIFDFKTGWKEQDAPAVNMQLRAYAYLIFHHYPEVTEIVAGLIPANFPTPTPCRYTRAELADIEFELVRILAKASASDAPRIPGDVCRYCRAYGTSNCPETCREIATVESALLELSSIKPEDAPAVLETLRRVALRADEGIKAMTDYKLAHPDVWPTLAIVPGATKSHVPNAEVAYGALADLVTASEFAGVCKVGVGDLKDLIETKIRAKEGIKGKALGTRLKDILAPITATKQDRPRLAAITAEKQIQ